MWGDDFTEMIGLLVMATLLRVVYELNRKKATQHSAMEVLPQTAADDNLEPDLTSQQKAWAEKAVKRYAEAQEKKWRRWNEVMFEAKQS